MIQGKRDKNVLGNSMHRFLMAKYVDKIMIKVTWIIWWIKRFASYTVIYILKTENMPFYQVTICPSTSPRILHVAEGILNMILAAVWKIVSCLGSQTLNSQIDSGQIVQPVCEWWMRTSSGLRALLPNDELHRISQRLMKHTRSRWDALWQGFRFDY